MTSLIVQRVKDNKDGEFFCYEISPKMYPEPVLACMKMTERAYELLCAIINICRDAEAEVAPAMVRSIIQFSESVALFSHFGTPPAHNFHSGRSKKSSPSSGIKSREAFCSARWRTQTSSKSAIPASSTHWTFSGYIFLDLITPDTPNWDPQVQSDIIGAMTMAEMQVRCLAPTF
jgi:hypothetical protein